MVICQTGQLEGKDENKGNKKKGNVQRGDVKQPKSLCLAKFLFWSYCPKCSWPIILPGLCKV